MVLIRSVSSSGSSGSCSSKAEVLTEPGRDKSPSSKQPSSQGTVKLSQWDQDSPNWTEEM